MAGFDEDFSEFEKIWEGAAAPKPRRRQRARVAPVEPAAPPAPPAPPQKSALQKSLTSSLEDASRQKLLSMLRSELPDHAFESNLAGIVESATRGLPSAIRSPAGGIIDFTSRIRESLVPRALDPDRHPISGARIQARQTDAERAQMEKQIQELLKNLTPEQIKGLTSETMTEEDRLKWILENSSGTQGVGYRLPSGENIRLKGDYSPVDVNQAYSDLTAQFGRPPVAEEIELKLSGAPAPAQWAREEARR